MCNTLMNSCSSPVEVEEAPGQGEASHCKLGNGNFLLNKHEGMEDVKLGSDIFEDFKNALHLLDKPVKIGNDTET